MEHKNGDLQLSVVPTAGTDVEYYNYALHTVTMELEQICQSAGLEASFRDTRPVTIDKTTEGVTVHIANRGWTVTIVPQRSSAQSVFRREAPDTDVTLTISKAQEPETLAKDVTGAGSLDYLLKRLVAFTDASPTES